MFFVESQDIIKQKITVLEAIKYLAQHCDGAQSNDGAGFTKSDAEAYAAIAHYSSLSPVQEIEWYKRLQKYRNTQLAWAEVEKPVAYNKNLEHQIMEHQRQEDKIFAKNNKFITINSDGIVTIKFPYNPNIISGIKKIPSHKWNSSEKVWNIEITKNSIDIFYQFCEEYEFTLTKELKEEIEKYRTKNDRKYNSNTITFVKNIKNKVLEIAFKYNPEVLELVKSIPGVKFKPDKKTWRVTVTKDKIKFLQQFFLNNSFFDVAEDVKQYIDKQALIIDEEERQKEQNLILSTKSTSSIDIKPFKNGLELRSFQKVAVEYSIINKRVIIGDEMGLGKTIEALGIIHQLNAVPAVIVTPNSLKLNWKNEVNKWLNYSVSVIESKKEKNKINKNDWNSDIIIINYDIVDKFLDQLLAINPKIVIMDESHYLKNKKSKRTRAVKKLVKKSEYRIMLTGTAILNRPIELVSQLDILGKLNMFGGFWNFVNRYCNPYYNQYGLVLNGSSNTKELHNELRKICYIRRNKSEVLTELPEKQRSVVILPITNASIYRLAEYDIVTYLRNEIAEKESFLKSIENLTEEEKQIKIKEYHDKLVSAATRAEHLVRINHLKMLAAEGKMEAAIEWIENFIENDEKLVLFAYHTKIIDQLVQHFHCPKIDGSVSIEERQKAVNSFQTDPNVKLIVLNLKAGSTGLTLTAASNVAFLELGWTPADMEQAEDRCHRIGQRNAVTAWYLLGKNTIDNDIYNLIEKKRKITDAVNKGEFVETTNLNIIDELILNLTDSEKLKQLNKNQDYEY